MTLSKTAELIKCSCPGHLVAEALLIVFWLRQACLMGFGGPKPELLRFLRYTEYLCEQTGFAPKYGGTLVVGFVSREMVTVALARSDRKNGADEERSHEL